MYGYTLLSVLDGLLLKIQEGLRHREEQNSQPHSAPKPLPLFTQSFPFRLPLYTMFTLPEGQVNNAHPGYNCATLAYLSLLRRSNFSHLTPRKLLV